MFNSSLVKDVDERKGLRIQTTKGKKLSKVSQESRDLSDSVEHTR